MITNGYYYRHAIVYKLAHKFRTHGWRKNTYYEWAKNFIMDNDLISLYGVEII